jgi:hypothetical protein
MRRSLATLVALTLSTVSGAQTPAPAARAGVITGQVVDADSGKPVSAVKASGSIRQFCSASCLAPRRSRCPVRRRRRRAS